MIEDDPAQAEAIVDGLRLAGCKMAMALQGIAGVEKARTFRPDVVVCDIRLPDIDGFEVARRIRADPALRRSRLVAVSAYASPEHRARSWRAGFDAHLCKPPSLEDLERLIVTPVR